MALIFMEEINGRLYYKCKCGGVKRQIDYNALANLPNLWFIPAEEQLATGVLGTDYIANTVIDTGITVGDLRQFRKFAILWKGSANTSISNVYFKVNGGNTIMRLSAAGVHAEYEWVDAERTLLMVTYFCGNPSGVSIEGIIVGNNSSIHLAGSSATRFQTYLTIPKDTDDLGVILQTGSTPTITYEWAIKGLFK